MNFRAKRQTIDGIEFASMKEAKRYGELKLLERCGVIRDLTPHPAYKVEINGSHFCRYTADFSYVAGGQLIIEDVKSTGTQKDSAYRLRKKAAELFHGIKITEVLR